jgi:hypothetical protein
VSRKYVEDVIDSVYDWLVLKLPAKLETIRTERSSDYPALYGHISKRPSFKMLFPKITIYKDDTDRDYNNDNQPLIRPMLLHNLIISIEHMSSSLDEIDSTLMRYSEAINRIVEDDDEFGGAFIWVKIGREDWTPVLTNQKDKKSIQGVLIPILCKTI